jgi:predicted amidohydrolase YtcJ
LLQRKRKIALGTDFPVEEVNPMLTFHAAVARKDSKVVSCCLQTEKFLSREEPERNDNMGAFSNLRKRKAVLEVGKWADLVILIRFNANFRK